MQSGPIVSDQRITLRWLQTEERLDTRFDRGQKGRIFGSGRSGQHLQHLGGLRDATQETPIASTGTGDTAEAGGLVHDGPDRNRSFQKIPG
jgi:hypothetical protein